MSFLAARSLLAFSLLLGLVLSPLLVSCRSLPASKPIVIAHRGASGYLPEHTLEAKALAFGMGADFLEQDVVLTRDGHPVVLHDIHLDTVTDVARVFPGRAREDGRYYAIDFSLAEIRRLRVNERIDLESGRRVFSERFPAGPTTFTVPTLEEEILMIRGLNQSTARSVGIYPEIKRPAWHRREGQDIAGRVLEVLERHGYGSAQDACWLQCFDPAELRRIREELDCKLRLVQLIANPEWNEAVADYDAMRTEAGLRAVSEYAEAIGPWLEYVIEKDDSGALRATGMVAAARSLGLVIHPYTARRDALPSFAEDLDHLLRLCFDVAGVDGVFADHPDLVRRHLDAR